MKYRGFNEIRDEIICDKVRAIRALDIYMQTSTFHDRCEEEGLGYLDVHYYSELKYYNSILKALSELQAEVEKFIYRQVC